MFKYLSLIQNRILSFINEIKKDKLQIQIFKDVGSTFVIKILGLGISFLLQLLLARTLGVDEFGSYVYVTTWMMTLTLIGKVGFDTSSIRYVSEYINNDEWSNLRGFIRRAFQIPIIISTIIILLIILFVRSMGNLELIDSQLILSFWFAAPMIVFISLQQIQTGILRGSGQVSQALTVELLIYPLLMIIMIGIIALLDIEKINALAAIIINTASLIIILIIQQILIRHNLPIFKKEIIPTYATREWFGTSFSLSLSGGLQQLIRRIDVLFIGTYIGTREAGIYSLASRLIQLVDLGLRVTNLASAHLFSPLHKLGKRVELQRVVYLTARISFISTLPIILGLFIGADKVMQLFGKDFSEGLVILQVLLIGELVNVATGPNLLLLSMTGYQNDLFWIVLLSLVIDVVLILLLSPLWGVAGVAVATAFTLAFRNITTVGRVWHHLKLNSTVLNPRAWIFGKLPE